jgi:predicted 3-demethylubiquinone-9 3-methyltransferase (glyoxalase superfamily)
MATTQRITNCLWFDNEAEEAAKLYTSIFPNSSIGQIARYTEEGFEFHQKPAGSVMTVNFTLDGQKFVGLNGGPIFKFNEAMSLMINCESQEEIDHYWYKLTADGGQEGPCGWLKDKFEVSWQVAPTKLMEEMQADPDKSKVERVTKAYMQMKKFDIETLKKAFNGEA